MERYKFVNTIADGPSGTVYKGVNNSTGEVVAIKKLKKKLYTWEDCMSTREIRALRRFNHPNIVKLREVIKSSDEIYFVFEYLEQNLFSYYQSIKDKGLRLSENQIRSILYQLASGLNFMHKNGFFHRDIKPENILYHKEAVKLADFSSIREVRSKPPYTDYISARWYRAPEVILKSGNYSAPVDIFALGCIMAELYVLEPFFCGTSELDQIHKICEVIGTPSHREWPEAYRLASQLGFTFPNTKGAPLAKIIPNACNEAIELLTDLLRFDPNKRPTAAQILGHNYFTGFIPIPREKLDIVIKDTKFLLPELKIPDRSRRNLLPYLMENDEIISRKDSAQDQSMSMISISSPVASSYLRYLARQRKQLHEEAAPIKKARSYFENPTLRGSGDFTRVSPVASMNLQMSKSVAPSHERSRSIRLPPIKN